MTDRDWGLTPEEAIAKMTEKSENNIERRQEGLEGIDSQTSFWLGYETALHDYAKFIGENPVEAQVVFYEDPPAPLAISYQIDVSEKENQ